jgi:nicotinamidase-related amidase
VTSEPVRDATTDHLLTPYNSALIIIDYQPLQVSSVASMNRRELVMNIMAVTRLAKLFRLPIVLSTVNVKAKGSEPTIHQLRDLLPDTPELDRTTINSWEDKEFLKAVKRRAPRS